MPIQFGSHALNQEHLENLRYYKYAAVDKSLISNYILRHYWNAMVHLFPRWMAPNLITLLGLGFMMINVLFIIIYVPDLGTEAPSWLYFSFAAGLWLYSTFDNVDGKQARRTGTSSPLGELFDHGCDALNCTCVALLQAAALGLGHSFSTVALVLVTIVGFYLSTAEEYFTGVLYLGIVNGPTEGILVSCLAFIWSGVYGASSWHVPLSAVSRLSWISSHLPNGTCFADIFVWGMILFFLITHCPFCFASIYTVCQEKSLKLSHVLLTILYPITLYSLAIYLWVSSPYSHLFENQDIILFSLTIGILFGMMASDIIVAHLTRNEFPPFKVSLGLLWTMALLVNLPFLRTHIITATSEHILLWILFLSLVVLYLVWATRIIQAFCKYLGINCLTIRHTNQTIPRSTEEHVESDALLDQQEQGQQASTSTNGNNKSYSTFE
ncbi:CDP-alcohol phosphatidyltransferase-domain-containing protein [Halteromyces radiatus]|uniref:CDP-alcohol phosphatidyltransferase-domain-containing protein n=1 Tax=Halteromyces radiatus TaxID=101107 RepID=UPI002220AE92|nr:CDP-alcohol phosphatidyltransferase-domain-containing protein [Halteromyces radiatus]KAI8082891.1 CDP-alcohol phosphatidyltransferase-domain-containing protein [Halteromyces radiatus]